MLHSAQPYIEGMVAMVSSLGVGGSFVYASLLPQCPPQHSLPGS